MRRVDLIAFAGAAAIAISACGTPSTGPSGATGPAATQAVQASSITIAVADAPGHLDRQIYAGTSALVNQMINYNVTETLLKLAPDGALKPLLAEKWDRIDPQTVRFTLRQGVKFSDGAAWNAEAAKVNFDRMMTLKGGAWKNEFPSVTKVTALSEYVLEVAHTPDATIPRVFSHTARMFSPKQIKEAEDSIKSAPIGSGPYVVKSFDKATALILEARADYWGKSTAADPIKTVKFVFRPEAGTRVAMLKAGEADLVVDLLPDDAKQFDAGQVTRVEGFEVYNLRFGLKDPLTSDVRVREAISLALDRKAFLSLFSGFADNVGGYQMWPTWVTGGAKRPVVSQDLAKAKSLVQEAGAAGKELTMVAGVGRWLLSGEFMDVAADMIRQTGLKVNVIKKSHDDWKVITRDLKTPPQVLFGSNGHEAGDATENFAKKFMCGGELSTYCSTEFDAVAKQALAEPDPDKRTALVQKATDLLARDIPYVPVFSPAILYGKNAKLAFSPIPNGLLSLAEFRYFR